MGTALLVTLVSLASTAGSAEEPAYWMDEVVVTAGRTPYQREELPFLVSVLGTAQLALSVAADPADLLRQFCTVRVTRHGGLGAEAGLQIGGLSAVHTLVLVDGRPVNSPDVGTADLGQISLEDVGKVEVLSGAASSLYGPGALSGVVHFLSSPLPSSWKVAPQFRMGTWNTGRAAVTVGGPLGVLSAGAGASVTTTSGHRPNSCHLGRELRLAAVRDLIALRAGWHDETSGSPGPRPPANPLLWTPTQEVLGNDLVSSLEDELGKESRYVDLTVGRGPLRVRAYRQRWNRTFDQQYVQWVSADPPSCARHVLDADHRSDQASVELRADVLRGKRFLSASAWLAGEEYEAETSDVDANTGWATITAIDGARTVASALLHGGATLGAGTIEGGLRWDNPSDLPSQLSPRVAGTLPVSAHVLLRGSFGRGYRSPTLADLHWPADPWSQGNANLDVEESWTAEVGAALAFGEWRADLSLQHRDVKNLIQWAPTGPPNEWSTPKWQPSNVAKMVSRTATVQLQGAGRWGHVAAGYALCDAERTAEEITNGLTYATTSKVRRAPFQPEHRFTLAWTPPSWRGFELAAHIEAVSDVVNYYVDWSSMDLATGTVPTAAKTLTSYAVLSAKARKALEHNAVYVEIDNLLAASYATQFGDLTDRDYPMPGRSVTVGLEVSVPY